MSISSVCVVCFADRQSVRKDGHGCKHSSVFGSFSIFLFSEPAFPRPGNKPKERIPLGILEDIHISLWTVCHGRINMKPGYVGKQFHGANSFWGLGLVPRSWRFAMTSRLWTNHDTIQPAWSNCWTKVAMTYDIVVGHNQTLPIPGAFWLVFVASGKCWQWFSPSRIRIPKNSEERVSRPISLVNSHFWRSLGDR